MYFEVFRALWRLGDTCSPASDITSRSGAPKKDQPGALLINVVSAWTGLIRAVVDNHSTTVNVCVSLHGARVTGRQTQPVSEWPAV